MSSNQSIALIGPMGSGKTSVGRRLACVLKRDFFDSDHEIVARTGVSIDHIFDVEGEEGFRERETNILSELLVIPDMVIATGGGIIIKKENRDLLKKNAFVNRHVGSLLIPGLSFINNFFDCLFSIIRLFQKRSIL